jgi:hypothetical protein
MGVDAVIYCEVTGTADADGLPYGASWRLTEEPDFGPKGSTHEVRCGGARLYDIGYERGYWPELCGILMNLHESPNIGRVWYDGDAGDDAGARLCDPDRVLAISRHYMTHGNRPYRARLASS